MRCVHCKTKFSPRFFLQKFCLKNSDCENASIKFAKKKIKQIDVKEKRDWNKKKKEIKQNLEPLSYWLGKLEEIINSIVREIDYGLPCISCKGNGKPQAGHYHSVKSDTTIRFNFHNIHIQDYRCNVELSSNIIGYDEGLIEIYGKSYWEYVKFGIKKDYNNALQLRIPDIKCYIDQAKIILNRMRKNQVVRSPEERIELRTLLNLEIGIYQKNYC